MKNLQFLGPIEKSQNMFAPVESCKIMVNAKYVL